MVDDMYMGYSRLALKVIKCRECKGCITKINSKKLPDPAYIGDKYSRSKRKVLVIVHNPLIGSSSGGAMKTYLDIKKHHLGWIGTWKYQCRASLIKLHLVLNEKIKSKQHLTSRYHSIKHDTEFIEDFSWTNLVKCDIVRAKATYGIQVSKEMYQKCPDSYLFEDISILKPKIIILGGSEVLKYFVNHPSIKGLPPDILDYYLESNAGEVYKITIKGRKYICGIMGHPYHSRFFNNSALIRLRKNLSKLL